LQKDAVIPLPLTENSVIEAEETIAVFDYVAMSERLMDDNDLIVMMTEAFLDDMPVQIEQLKKDIDAENLQQATAQSHKIKGAAANVGGLAFSERALIMERAGKLDDMETLSKNFDKLGQQFAELKSVMEQKIL
jgi:HPt (histidine-containing phosphotransfer) domain-containing protein